MTSHTSKYSTLAKSLTHSVPRTDGAHLSERLLALASAELILPALYPRLRASNTLPRLPSDLTASLHAVTELNRERNLFILRDSYDLIALLNHAGVQPISLKGIACLLAGIYPDPAERYLLDVDLLVAEPQLPAAIAAVTNAGYSPQSTGTDPIADLRHHAPAMLRQGHVRIELHRAIGQGLAARILPASEIIAHAQPITLPEHPDLLLQLPSPEHLVTHLIIHSQISNVYRERIWPPLRALYDLLCLTRHFTIDWPIVESLFRNAGQLTTLKLHSPPV